MRLWAIRVCEGCVEDELNLRWRGGIAYPKILAVSLGRNERSTKKPGSAAGIGFGAVVAPLPLVEAAPAAVEQSSMLSSPRPKRSEYVGGGLCGALGAVIF